MSPDNAPVRPKIRRLWKLDRSKLRAHFQRLDPETRRMRFGGVVSDGYVTCYAEHMLSPDAVVFGAFPDGTLRGVSELRGVHANRGRSAEVALLVEPVWQGLGLGDALMHRLIVAAQNRRIRTLRMMCLRENAPMRHLSIKHHATLDVDVSDIEATLEPHWPTPFSMFEEMFGDPPSYFDGLFHPARRAA